MTTDIPYGWAVGVDDELCIADSRNSWKMLCGRTRGFMPEVVPAPVRVHEVCARLWESKLRRVKPRLDPYGRCPQCWGDVPLSGAVIGPHQALVRTRHGESFTGGPCLGAGMAPEVDG